MLFNQNQITKTVVMAMTLVLCGCAGRPGLSFPILSTKSIDGNVVSLRSVAQDGRTAYYQPAKSVRTPQHWPQPERQSTAMAPSHPVPFRSHPVRQPQHQQQSWAAVNQSQQFATPLVGTPHLGTPQHGMTQHSTTQFNTPQQSAEYQREYAWRDGRRIRQVSQQQTAAPMVIQWDDHKQSSGSAQNTRTYSTSTFNAPTNAVPQAADRQTGQMPEQFYSPAGTNHHAVRQLGDGCGESTQTVDFEKINKLVQRVERMETELSSSNQSIKGLTTSLAAARFEISKLKKDVDFWQSEVLRLERSMKAQHRSDIASLNQISDVLETLLKEDGGAAASDDVPPDFDTAIDPFAPISR